MASEEWAMRHNGMDYLIHVNLWQNVADAWVIVVFIYYSLKVAHKLKTWYLLHTLTHHFIRYAIQQMRKSL